MEKAFFVYAWDLIAEGPEKALGKIQDLFPQRNRNFELLNHKEIVKNRKIEKSV